MSNPKTGTLDNKSVHYSVGALIEQDGRYLLIDRVKPPLGFAGIAGHVDEGEDAESSLAREVKEESGLELLTYDLVLEELIEWNKCSYDVTGHYWYLYRCEVSGEVKQSMREAKSIDWYTREQIADLQLEPVWEHWFKKLRIL